MKNMLHYFGSYETAKRTFAICVNNQFMNEIKVTSWEQKFDHLICHEIILIKYFHFIQKCAQVLVEKNQ